MIKKSAPIKSIHQAEKNLDNIKECIEGLFEILNINISEDDMYLKMGRDNLINLYKNILELVFNDFGLKQIRTKVFLSETYQNLRLDEDVKLQIKSKTI
ncbi:MAG: hypothetical protein P8Y70_15780 [Candidatus Lokiarchaeota archaeon]